MQIKATTKILLPSLLLFSAATLFSGVNLSEKKILSKDENEKTNLNEPNEWFYAQRSYPQETFSYNAYSNALQNIQQSVNNKSTLRSSSISGWDGAWIQEGPGNTGGRINVVAVHPSNQNIIYAGNSTGGIFKTTDGGVNWISIFDAQSYLSIGAIVFEPGNPNTIYVGTGDPNISGFAFIGNGIYVSRDAGVTWAHLGLSAESIISKIVVNPLDTNIIYVATMGLPFTRTPDRGLYKTIDGGLTWNNILFVNDSAGIIDLTMDFSDPEILYAASWNRIRNNHESIPHGPDAKIFKTTNGGTTWTQLQGGLPSGDFSRISLSMSGTNHNTMFASYADTVYELYNIYKTTNGGTSWTTVNISDLNNPFNGQGWYSGGVTVNPTDNNELILCGVDLYQTTNNGNSWNQISGFGLHADMHDVKFYDANTIYLTTDGGMYKTTDDGNNWNDIEDIPNNQFYHITYDPVNIGIYAGGVQDNGTNTGNASMINSWNKILGADGFKIIYHPVDANIIYAETQNGGIYVSTDGGFSFNDATFGIGIETRNWDMPYIMSSADPLLMYAGTNMIYQNTSGENPFWSPVSPLLVDAFYANEDRFHTITCIDESPVNVNILYAATSDGHVWTSTDAGSNWNEITGTLPNRYVTCIKASQANANTAFVSHSGYRDDDNTPQIHKTTDNGNSWSDISGDLPLIAINCIMLHQTNDDILFVGTDGGVYGTLNGGINWTRVGNNMPVVPVYDLQLDPNANKILAGTHGRSLMSYSMDSILLSMHGENSSNTSINIFPNPVVDFLKVSLKNQKQTEATINIFSASGVMIKEYKMLISKTFSVSVKDITSGIYFISIKGNEVNAVKRFVKM